MRLTTNPKRIGYWVQAVLFTAAVADMFWACAADNVSETVTYFVAAVFCMFAAWLTGND